MTCVGGNAPLADVVRNTLVVLETAGRGDVPVGVGAARPLLEDPVDARHVHGADGMADLGMPAPTLRPDPRPALDLLRDTIDAAAAAGERVTVLPLAPMTNLALLARVHPAGVRPDRPASSSWVAASSVSNATAAAEFNVFHDPEAAAIVLDACADHGVPVTMYGLDVFYDPLVTDVQVAGLREVDTPVARLAAGLISFHHRRFANAGATIGDAGRGRRSSSSRMPCAPSGSRCGSSSPAPGPADARSSTAVTGAAHLAHDPHGLAPATGRRGPRDRRAADRRPLGAHDAGRGDVTGRVLVLGSLNVDLVTRVERHPAPRGDGAR